MTLSASGDVVEHDAPVPLFAVPNLVGYVPSRDGKKFRLNRIIGGVSTPPITVIMNWRRK